MSVSQLNQQPISKVETKRDGKTLAVHSIFFTIQGEGPFSGRRAAFIRLIGCNLQCPYCDTEYSAKYIDEMPIENILWQVQQYETKFIVVTGGEPFRQNLVPLFELLTEHGYTIQVETNGTLPPPQSENIHWKTKSNLSGMHYIVCSPKTPRINGALSVHIYAYKYVIECSSVVSADGLPITCVGHPINSDTNGAIVARPSRWWFGDIYITPLDQKSEKENKFNLELAAEIAKKFGYILQVQLHKIIGIE